MRIAYLVDVHDRVAAVREAVGAIGDVDLLVIGGDITTGGTPDDAQRAIEREQRGSWAFFRLREEPLAALRALLA